MIKRISVPLLLFSAVLTFIISCASGSKEYSDCYEKCEYNRRYCFEACGGPDNAGFTFDMKDLGKSKPYSCQEKCDSNSDKCKANCDILK